MEEMLGMVLGLVFEGLKLFAAGALAGGVSAYLGFKDKQIGDGTVTFDREKFIMTIVRGALIGGVTVVALGNNVGPTWVLAFSALAAISGDTLGRRVWAWLKDWLGEQEADSVLGKIVWAIDYVVR